MTLDLAVNADSALIGLNKQARFAASVALNRTAKAVQSQTLDKHLPSKFTLRSKGAPWQKPGTKMGFNAKFSNRSNLTAVLGSQADWLKLQEHGGVKKPATGRAKTVAVPMPTWKAKTEIMAAAKKPKVLLADSMRDRKTLLADLKRSASEFNALKQKVSAPLDRSLKGRLQRSADKKELAKARRAFRQAKKAHAASQFAGRPFAQKMRGLSGIWVRATGKRFPVKLLFAFHKTTNIKPVLAWESTMAKFAQTKFTEEFRTAFAQAMLTAKP